MNSVIIAFGHKARQGKDICVGHILAEYADKYSIKRYGFGDGVKTELYDLLLHPTAPYWDLAHKVPSLPSYLSLPHPREQFVSDEAKVSWVNDNKQAIVLLMQHYGTEYRRAQDPLCWIRKVKEKIEKDSPQIALISDLRFKNEFYFVKSHQGWTVRVERVGFVDPNRDPEHPSEIDLDDILFDYEITCESGDLDTLREDADTVFSMILEKEKALDE